MTDTTTSNDGPLDAGDVAPGRRHRRWWIVITAVEVGAAAVAVVLDLLVPTFVLLALASVSLLARRQGFSTLGFHRVAEPRRLVIAMFGFAALWSVFQLAVVMPIVNHVSGTTQDLSDFEQVHGNVGMLLGVLVLSWTIAAVGEETAYRGYLLTRVAQLFGSGRGAIVVAVVASSALFGIAHSEQGLVGVVVTSIDAVVFAILRFRCKTLWASVLAHGFNNTIGFVAFFLVGPVHGFW